MNSPQPQTARQKQAAAPRRAVAAPGLPMATRPLDELPPSARVESGTNRGDSASTTARPKGGLWKKLAFAVAITVVGSSLWPAKNQEAGSANWNHHRDAGSEGTTWVGRTSLAAPVTGIALGQADVQTQLTREIQTRLRFGSVDQANQLLQAANAGLSQALQGTPLRPDSIVLPSLSPALAQQLARGESSLFQVHLADSCYEDGDIVELVIDGHAFATVPITNSGIILTLPLANRGTTQVSIRGIHDGGGGITVACETSQGTGFVRVLQVGESQSVSFGSP